MNKGRIICASLTHNDLSKGWLDEWIKTNQIHFDEWIILDDCSDDGTFEYLNSFEMTCKKQVYQMPESTFVKNENKLRSYLWNKVRKTANSDDWIIVLDSDEMLCPEFSTEIESVLNKGKHNLLFRKIEMWDDKNYNILGFWSNYFGRMFPYYDVEWHSEEPGFHISSIPAKIRRGLPWINTNIRIKHLAYNTEERRNKKYNFMMLSEQQDKSDINYKHLQTINAEPVLKEYKDEIQYPKTSILIVCVDLYCLPKSTIEFLKNTQHKVFVAISRCDSRIIKEIDGLNNSNVSYQILNIKNEDFYSKINNKKALIKTYAVDKIIEDCNSEHFFIIDGEFQIDNDIIKHYLTTDRDFIFDRSSKLVSMSKRMMELICSNPESKKAIGSFNYGELIKILKDNDLPVWIGSMNDETTMLLKK